MRKEETRTDNGTPAVPLRLLLARMSSGDKRWILRIVGEERRNRRLNCPRVAARWRRMAAEFLKERGYENVDLED